MVLQELSGLSSIENRINKTGVEFMLEAFTS